MSFDVVCQTCGAPSSPSVGICPFCKTPFSSASGNADPSVEAIEKYYDDGNLSQALALANSAVTAKPDVLSRLDFVLLFVRILIETDGPGMKISGLLSTALIQNPNHPELLQYVEFMEAKSHLTNRQGDVGEIALQKILRRSPDNALVLFTLGAHMFWSDGETLQSIKYLERCVQIRPNFLRAWGCLGSIYQKIGNVDLAKRSFQKCLNLETDPRMRSFFQKQIV